MPRSVRRWRVVVALAISLVLAAPAVANARSAYPYPFRDPHLSLSTRIADLLSRLTLAEKVSLLHQYEPAIPRLGIPAFKTGTEALHGVAWSNDINNNGAVVTANGTVFPQAVGLASTWDPALIKQVGNAVGQEARGFNAENPHGVGAEPVGAGGEPAARPALGPQRGGLLRGPVPDRRDRHRLRQRHRGRQPDATCRPRPRSSTTWPTTTSRTARPQTRWCRRRSCTTTTSRRSSRSSRANAATGVMASYNLVNGRPNTVNPDLATTERGWTGKTLMNVTDASGPNNLVGPGVTTTATWRRRTRPRSRPASTASPPTTRTPRSRSTPSSRRSAKGC